MKKVYIERAVMHLSSHDSACNIKMHYKTGTTKVTVTTDWQDVGRFTLDLAGVKSLVDKVAYKLFNGIDIED